MSSFLLKPDSAIIGLQGGDAPTSKGDQLVGETTNGGPLSGQDVRMILDREGLEHLLKVSKQSLSGRVVLHGVGFRQRAWRGGDGNTYVTLQLICHPPKPEQVPFAEGSG